MNSYFVIYGEGLEKDLENISIKDYIILNPQLALIYVNDNFKVEKFRKLSSIKEIIKTMPISTLTQINESIAGGESIEDASGINYINNNPYINVSGKNILIGIIDSGIDYLNKTFIDDNNESKIISIWNQEISENFDNEKSIISKQQIDEAIKNNDNSLLSDDIGSGTMNASIVSSIAKDSKLVVVKLKNYQNPYTKNSICYNDGNLFSGIKYILDISEKLDMPVIINLTVGAISSNVEQINLLDTFEQLNVSGNFFVSGIGNEGNTSIHVNNRLKSINDVRDIIFQVGEQKDLEIILEPKNIDKISAQLISPSGEVSFKSFYSPKTEPIRGMFNVENTKYSMINIYPDLLTEKQKTYIYFKDIKPGTWTIRLTPQILIDGEFNLYLPNKNLLSEETKFIDSDSISTSTLFSHSNAVIGVGVYNNTTDSMWLSSSKGSANSAYLKPDIVAPGVNIICDYLNNQKVLGTGSAISSSIVSGVLALIIEYLINQSQLSRLALFSEVIKTYLMLGATKKDIYKYPNISQGYGVLNLKNTIKEIADNL